MRGAPGPEPCGRGLEPHGGCENCKCARVVLLHWNARCCSFVVGCRRCVLHVRHDRDAYALAFCSGGGRRPPPCVLRLEHHSICWPVQPSTRGETRTRNLLPRREAPYPLGHTSSCDRSCSTPSYAPHRMSVDACICVCKIIVNVSKHVSKLIDRAAIIIMHADMHGHTGI